MGFKPGDDALAREGLAEQVEEEAPASVLLPIASKKVHATSLFPHLKYDKDKHGRKIPLPRRTGGQYSVRRLVLIDLFSKSERTDWVLPSLPSQQWGIGENERFSDPTKYKEDQKYGNIEVIFDFQTQLMAFWKSVGKRPPIVDPLFKNDYDSTKFPPDMRLPGPPGAVPTE